MIYRNEDGSIYRIECSILPNIPNHKISDIMDKTKKKSHFASPPPIRKNISNNGCIGEIIEVLNYLLKKIKHLPDEAIELPKPNDGEIVKKGG